MTSRFSRLYHLPVAALALVAASACESLPSEPQQDAALRASEDVAAEREDDEKQKKKKAEEREAREEKIEEKELKLVQLARKLEAAELDRKLGRRKGEDESAAAELAVRNAELDLATAQRAQAAFTGMTRPLTLAESKLAVERSERRLVEEKEELNGILEIYADEIEATRNKEVVIARYKKRVEFAERGLEIAKMKAAQTTDKDLAEQVEKLERGVQKATEALEKARKAAERQRMSTELDELKGENGILDAKDEISATKRAIEKLKKKAASEDSDSRRSDGSE